MESLTCFHLLFLLALIIGPVSASTKKSIFILAGQSNMAGRGGVKLDPDGKEYWDDKDIPAECQSSRSILRFNSKFSWEVATEPLHVDIDTRKVCGIGPGMPFAHELLKRDAASMGVIGLVPCAIGGTFITEWARGTTYYNQTLKRAFAALQEGGKIHALLWYQGENEAKYGVGSFAKDVPKFFTSIRKGLKIHHLPIIQVAVTPNIVGQFAKEIRNIQLHFNLPSLVTVDAMGSELKSDGVHLTTTAQVKLGKKMADAFLKMIHA